MDVVMSLEDGLQETLELPCQNKSKVLKLYLVKTLLPEFPVEVDSHVPKAPGAPLPRGEGLHHVSLISPLNITSGPRINTTALNLSALSSPSLRNLSRYFRESVVDLRLQFIPCRAFVAFLLATALGFNLLALGALELLLLCNFRLPVLLCHSMLIVTFVIPWWSIVLHRNSFPVKDAGANSYQDRLPQTIGLLLFGRPFVGFVMLYFGKLWHVSGFDMKLHADCK